MVLIELLNWKSTRFEYLIRALQNFSKVETSEKNLLTKNGKFSWEILKQIENRFSILSTERICFYQINRTNIQYYFILAYFKLISNIIFNIRSNSRTTYKIDFSCSSDIFSLISRFSFTLQATCSYVSSITEALNPLIQ